MKKTLNRKPLYLLLILTFIIGGVVLLISHRCRNIFDEMYYAAVEFPHVYSTDARYAKCEGTFEPTNNEAVYHTVEGFMCMDYNESIFPSDNMFISFMISPEEKTCKFSTGIRFPTEEMGRAENVIIVFIYDVPTKTLVYQPIEVVSSSNDEKGLEFWSADPATVIPYLEAHNVSKEQIEELKKYYLYDVVIASWIDGNGNSSNYTIDDPGTFTIIDNSYELLGESWK